MTLPADTATGFVRQLRAEAQAAGVLPLPGSGATARRWRLLADLAVRDVALARLVEAHADAIAILADLDAVAVAALVGAGPDAIWGVWAAAPPLPAQEVESANENGRWVLRGTKPWCSGAHLCTHALVTAASPDGRRLFAVALDRPGVSPGGGNWKSAGMARSDTEPVRFDDASAEPVGSVDAYYDRNGFWHGAIGVAACWFGGAQGVATALERLGAQPDPDPHALAHLGRVDATLAAAAALLEQAAAEVDADPAGPGAQRRALRVRDVVEHTATDVLERVGRALGPAPLATEAAHAERVADLQIYLRQNHAERDLATLGLLCLDGPGPGR